MNKKIILIVFLLLLLLLIVFKLKNKKENFLNLKKTNKVVFCFLIYSDIEHNDLWKKFFKDANPNKYSIVSHVKEVSKKTPQWIKSNMIPTIPTNWCDKNLVLAFINMLKKALKDKNNNHFALLSNSCIPLYNFNKTYKIITSEKKSRIHFYKKMKYYYGSQWVLLNRECVEILINLFNQKEGLELIKDIETSRKSGYPSCPDELYPINFFIKILGNPENIKFKKLINNKVSTYDLWDKENYSLDHPVKFNLQKAKEYKEKIYNSGALFARKFTKNAAEYITKK